MGTNRDYLSSLSSEELSKWLFDKLEIVDISGRYPLLRLDGIHYVTLSFIDPCMEFAEWLEQERKEISSSERG